MFSISPAKKQLKYNATIRLLIIKNECWFLAISFFVGFPYLKVNLLNKKWGVFLWMMISWLVLLGIYSLNVFDFFGDEWKIKLIKNKFKKE